MNRDGRMIDIEGSMGEGGEKIVACPLFVVACRQAIHHRPARVRPQRLAVAAARIGHARVEGDREIRVKCVGINKNN